MKTPGQTAKTTARNFIDAHGKPMFLRLIEMFQQNEPGPKIAMMFNVTRQRVHQWKVTLGQERVLYIPHPEIDEIVSGSAHTRKSV